MNKTEIIMDLNIAKDLYLASLSLLENFILSKSEKMEIIKNIDNVQIHTSLTKADII